MNKLKTLYFKIAGTPDAKDLGMGSSIKNYIKAEVYYDKGGYSCFTYKNRPRGYVVSAAPVGVWLDSCGTWESYEMFSAVRKGEFLFEVSRQSKKKNDEAVKYFDKNIDRLVKEWFPDILVHNGEEAVA